MVKNQSDSCNFIYPMINANNHGIIKIVSKYYKIKFNKIENFKIYYHKLLKVVKTLQII